MLTRQQVIKDEGLLLRYYLATESGAVRVELAEQECICFCPASEINRLSPAIAHLNIRQQVVPLKTFFHEDVVCLYASSSRDFRQLTRIATDLGIALHESDIRPEQRFLTERFIALDIECLGFFASDDVDGANNLCPTFHLIKARKADCNIKLRAISFDLECSFSGELYSAGFYSDKTAKVFMVGAEEDSKQDYIQWVKDEADLIRHIIAWFSQYDPDLIIGWAVVSFDLALLHRRAQLHGIPLTIGRAGEALGWKVADKYRPETLFLPGRVVLDGIDWLKAAFYQFERYSLEFVSRALLDEGKAINQVDDRAGEIDHLFVNDKQALAHYNLTDCRLVWDIFDKTQLFDFAIERARLTGLELGRVGASVEAFNRLYLPHLHRAGFVAPAVAVSDGLESPGGYVMDSIPGLYKDILVLDFKSLYPSIIQTFLIDPKGLAVGLRHEATSLDVVPGFLGALFSRDKPILPLLIEKLTAQRERAKQENNQPLSQAIKIIMNSLYGVLGSRGCLFHDARLASSITMRGHQVMQQTKAWIEEAGYKVIYGDTDSTFVWLGDRQGEVLAKDVGLELVAMVNRRWRDKLKMDFNLDCYLELEFERHFEQFFMPTLRGSDLGSKKRYVGMYTEQGQMELVFKGMEQVRSDWSPLARRVQYALYNKLFRNESVTDFMRDVNTDLRTGKLDNELIFSKRLRRDVEEYKSQSIPHVKAAHRLYEHSGDKGVLKRGAEINYVITVNGAQPNEHLSSAIDYDYYFDKQLLPICEPVFSLLGEDLSQVASSQLSLI